MVQQQQSTVSPQNNSTAASSIQKTVLVYRRLPPRTRLSRRHPVTNQPVPVPGCLWETVVTYPPEVND